MSSGELSLLPDLSSLMNTSDWSVMTTSTIAVLHGKPELAQTVLFGVVAVNLLLVLGIYSSYRQYEQVGSLHLSVSILSFVFIAMPTIASTRLDGTLNDLVTFSLS
jgi:Ca2+/Na+ antiporter